jgi:uncharacterized protein YdhG (YjbR/CyaY superfamily)
MSPIDDYLTKVTPAQRAEFERIRRIVQETIPSVEEGVSYAMPAYLYKGKAVLSAMARKNFLSIYPYSGKVIAQLADKLTGYETTSGSIHFSEEHPIPEVLLKEIIQARMEEIERKLGGGSRRSKATTAADVARGATGMRSGCGTM